jgi:hypothetical protein
VHHQYSSRVSPFQAKTAAESRATAAAAWSYKQGRNVNSMSAQLLTIVVSITSDQSCVNKEYPVE